MRLHRFAILAAALLLPACDTSDDDDASGTDPSTTGSATTGSGTTTSEPTGSETTDSTTDDSTTDDSTTTGMGGESSTGLESSSGGTAGSEGSSSTGEMLRGDEGDVRVDIDYAGAQSGPVVIGLFPDCDMGGELIATRSIPADIVVFPTEELFESETTALVAGDGACAIVYVDVGDDSPGGPGLGDPVGSSSFDTAEGGMTIVDVTIMD